MRKTNLLSQIKKVHRKKYDFTLEQVDKNNFYAYILDLKKEYSYSYT